MNNFRIQKRLGSSNIIEKFVDGKTWTPWVAPLCNKKEGDILTEELIKFLNK
jgi:hypothetical protein